MIRRNLPFFFPLTTDRLSRISEHTTDAIMADRDLIKGFLETAAGEWTLILSLVFGGCCSYVYNSHITLSSS